MMVKFNYIVEIFVVINILRTSYTHSKQYEKQDGMLYIALWTGTDNVPFKNWQFGQKSFTTMNCEYQNCFIVDDINFFKDVTEYDAILFNSIDLKFYTELPMARTDNQMYVFVSTEPSKNHPMIEKFNSFFNYTWTYKLDSDIHYPYFITRNERGEVIAPKSDVKWMDINDMQPTNQFIKDKLTSKKAAAAWFTTNCNLQKQFKYLHILRKKLQNHKYDVDVFGPCETIQNHTLKNNSFAVLESDYYFYLSFEDLFSKDYITEKVMNALDYYTVPIVMGGANYSKFMPNGIYLDANKLTGREMAEKMMEAIRNVEIYYKYFKWHKHYSYYMASESADTDPLCRFCAFINNASSNNQKRTYSGFTDWWNDDKDVTRYTIVYYNEPIDGTVYKIFPGNAKGKTTSLVPVIKHEPSVVEAAAKIAGELFGYLSNS